MESVPESHPRRKSILTRHALVDGFEKGLVCGQGLIAQGRGEAFDYLLGEETNGFAEEAITAAAATLLLARKPVISVNGNMAALCARDVVALASEAGAKIEVNLFYRTEDRIARIKKALREAGAREVLGGKGSGETTIPELFSERRRVSRKGIYCADVVLLALEDGDRTRALARMGKKVVAIDLNPLSVTSREASITIVDELTRAMPALCAEVARLKCKGRKELAGKVKAFDNKKCLTRALLGIGLRMKRLSGVVRRD